MAEFCVDQPPEVLREWLCYNPQTGDFWWRKSRPGRNGKQGMIAGSRRPDGYLSICFSGRQYLAHRLAHWWVTGAWPETVDHINRDKQDNRAANLRAATKLQQQHNRVANDSSTSRYKGVSRSQRPGKWLAQISIDRKTRNLGRYDSEHAAAMAYDEAARKHHGPRAVLNFGEVV